MWFAALGGYQSNPWLIHLVHKILNGCRPVLELLDEPTLSSGHDQIRAIRAIQYDYDFTRIGTPWNKKIPGVSLNQTQWWTRSRRKEYLPEIHRGDKSLDSFLSHYCFLPICFTKEERCISLKSTGMRKVCELLNIFRSKQLIWWCVLGILLLRMKLILQTKRRLQRNLNKEKEKLEWVLLVSGNVLLRLILFRKCEVFVHDMALTAISTIRQTIVDLTE